MSSVTSVLRLGPAEANSSTELVRNALVAHFSATKESDAPKHTLCLSNRYFSAQVLLRDVGSLDDTELYKEDGVVLVFDDDRASMRKSGMTTTSFDRLALVHQQAEEVHQCGELLRLCIGVRLGAFEKNGKEYENEYSRRVLWCLDRGYEYVEADMSDEGMAQGHDERDKDGFARIVEAIASTVWSSAQMEKKKQTELKKSYQEDKQLLSKQEEEEEESPAYVPPDPSNFPEITTTTTDADEKELAKRQQAILNEAKLESEAVSQQDIDQTQQEKAFASLESVIQEAQRIRDASVSGRLSDDERRQRASDAATLMMGLMNQLDFGEESEGEQEDSSDDDEGKKESS